MTLSILLSLACGDVDPGDSGAVETDADTDADADTDTDTDADADTDSDTDTDVAPVWNAEDPVVDEGVFEPWPEGDEPAGAVVHVYYTAGVGNYRPLDGELSGLEGEQVYLLWGERNRQGGYGTAFFSLPVTDAAVAGEVYSVTFLHGGIAGWDVPSVESRVGFTAGDPTDPTTRATKDVLDPADGVMSSHTHSWTATDEVEGLPIHAQFIANNGSSAGGWVAIDDVVISVE